MKEVKTFNKKSVYSDVELPSEIATFLKFMGKDSGVSCFRLIGGDEGYLYSSHTEYGRIIKFGKDAVLFKVTGKDVQELIESGKITI